MRSCLGSACLGWVSLATLIGWLSVDAEAQVAGPGRVPVYTGVPGELPPLPPLPASSPPPAWPAPAARTGRRQAPGPRWFNPYGLRRVQATSEDVGPSS